MRGLELNAYIVIGAIVCLIVTVSSIIKGGNVVEALIGGVMVGGIVGGLLKIGKDRLSGP